MITHGNEQVKEQGATLFHLKLHGTALLKVVAAADDECEILSSKLRVRIRGMFISPTSRGQDGGNLHALTQALFPKGEAFELIKAIQLGRATRRNSIR